MLRWLWSALFLVLVTGCPHPTPGRMDALAEPHPIEVDAQEVSVLTGPSGDKQALAVRGKNSMPDPIHVLESSFANVAAGHIHDANTRLEGQVHGHEDEPSTVRRYVPGRTENRSV